VLTLAMMWLLLTQRVRPPPLPPLLLLLGL